MVAEARRLVLVEWVDSVGGDSGWEHTDQSWVTEDRCPVVRSVGWVLHDGESVLRLTATHQPADEALCVRDTMLAHISVPRCAVLRVVDLVERSGT